MSSPISFASSEASCPPTEVIPPRQDPFPSPNPGSLTASSPPRPASTTASPEVQDVLRMIPLNTEARRAFHTVALSAEKGSLDPLHTRYLHVTGKRPLGHQSEATNDSGETTDDVASDPPTMVYDGHYRVHFALPAIFKGPKWVYIRSFHIYTSPSFLPYISIIMSCRHSLSISLISVSDRCSDHW